MIGCRVTLSAGVSHFAGKVESEAWRIEADEANTPEQIIETVDEGLRRLRAHIVAHVKGQGRGAAK